MREFKPMLFSNMKQYSPKQFLNDVTAGIIVAIIALPLSVALALASGVGPEQGLYTAIIAGFLISFFGGSRVQIAGPTAAFATIVAGIVAKNGMGGLAVATVIAGILLIIMGLLKLGKLIKYIPYTITTGFTAGIAVTIVIGQLKDFFGVTYSEKPIESVEKVYVFLKNVTTINIDALIVGGVCLLILFLFPKLTKKIPASLIAVFAGILMVKFLPLSVNTIGDLYPNISNQFPSIKVPEMSIDTVKTLFPDALTIAVLAAIESLLSCVVSDSMINSRHRSNMELISQGIGNVGSALFGGIPATGAIARTAANVDNGGRTPVAGMVHSVVLAVTLVVLMPYAKIIPMPVIAAILINVAYNMCQWKPFVQLIKKAPKSDIAVLLVTFLLTVIFDIVVAIEFGLILTAALFIKKMSDESDIRKWNDVDEEDDKESIHLRKIPDGVRVYELNGPLFFAVSNIISKIKAKDDTKCIILRMRSVITIDYTALKSLEELCEKYRNNGVYVIFSHVNPKPMMAIQKAGLDKIIDKDNFCKNIDEALKRAEEIARIN